MLHCLMLYLGGKMLDTASVDSVYKPLLLRDDSLNVTCLLKYVGFKQSLSLNLTLYTTLMIVF